jgi:anaerobic selenocysteine-containing dehydrogenase
MGLSGANDPVPEPDLIAAILDSSEDGVRIQRSLAVDGQAIAACGATPVQFLDVFPQTADGKIHLVPESLDREAPAGLYRYEHAPQPPSSDFPLTLISPATSKTLNSTFGQLHKSPVAVALNPEDAKERGISAGASVRVWNSLGEVRCSASIDADLRPGVAVLPKGLWSHHTDNGATANALIPDDLTDIGFGPCYYDARVEIALQ